MKLGFVLVFLIYSLCSSFPVDDQVTYFDGQPAVMNFQMFSGYLDSLNSKRIHYIFCTSELEPGTDTPIMIYLTGGGGGITTSTLWEFWYGFGPFTFNYKDFNDPFLHKNQLAWNKYTHLLLLEGIAGVGFSDSAGDTSVDDEQAVADLVAALSSFYTKFSEYQKTDSWIIGSGYGGLLAPMVITELDRQNSTLPINKMILANGKMDRPYLHTSLYDFMWGHYLMSQDNYDKFVSMDCFNRTKFFFPECEDFAMNISQVIQKSSVNVYNIYELCVNPRIKTKDKFILQNRCLDQERLSNFLNTDSFANSFHVDPRP